MMTMKKTTVQLQLGGGPCILLQSRLLVQQDIKLRTTHVKQSICSHKQAACPGNNFEETIFVVEVKSTKTAKFIVLKNFPLYGSHH